MPNIYADCAHIKKPAIDYSVNKELAKDYDLLPLYEKDVYEYVYKKYYSLKTNEYFKCRWNSYKDKIHERVFAPFEFVNVRNFHVINGQVNYIPSDSFQNRKDYRHKLKPGPGVDFVGQVPIPDELLMKRGVRIPNIPKKKLNTLPKDMNKREKIRK